MLDYKGALLCSLAPVFLAGFGLSFPLIFYHKDYLQQFASGKLSGGRITRIYEELVKRLTDAGEELPVKVEAAMAIQRMLEAQTKC